MSLLNYVSFAPVQDGCHQLKLTNYEETGSSKIVNGITQFTEAIKLYCVTETGKQVTLTDVERGFHIHMDQLRKFFADDVDSIGAEELLKRWMETGFIPAVRNTKSYVGTDGQQRTAINWYLGYTEDRIGQTQNVSTEDEELA